MTKAHILGIPLDNLSHHELKRAIKRLFGRHHGHITTPNPEFLLLAQKDSDFFTALSQADLSIPDGIGLKFAGWIRGVNLKRYSGANLVREFLKLANYEHARVAVINWRGGLSNDEEIFKSIKALYPKLVCLVASVERDGTHYNIQSLRAFRPDIVFVALGAPYQEKFIRRRILRDLPSIRFAMGVGGSFDFITGKVRRAPELFQKFGFEWLWRLVLQPLLTKQKNVFSLAWRIKRIWNAVIVFPLEVIAWEFRRFFYRPNVVMMIVNQFREVLILNRVGRRDYWGLPQGGVDFRENIIKAAYREMAEESGVQEAELLGYFKNISQYVWPKHYTNRGYKGQRQTLFIFSYNGTKKITMDRNEHKEYKWVKLERLVSSSSPIHAKNYKLFLQKYYALQRSKH